MSSSLKKSTSSSSRSERGLSAEQQQAKVDEVRELLGSLAIAMPYFVADAMIRRFLAQKSWKPQKASKAMREVIKWRLEYKPEAIRWEDVAEGAAGKTYRADYTDKHGRTVLIIKSGGQPSKADEKQRCFVYHLEHAMMSLAGMGEQAQGQEQVVALSDFDGWTVSSTPMKNTRSTLHILQSCYPGMIGLAIIHNPPRLFQAFWRFIRPLVDASTYDLAKFVYTGDAESQRFMAELFDVDAMEEAYGGKKGNGFDAIAYGERMREEDRKMEAARQRAVAVAAAAALAKSPCSTNGETAAAGDDINGSLD